MMFRATMAEAQAMAICWLARASGLPPIHSVRVSVVQMHPTTCGWCDYELGDLMRMLKEANGHQSLEAYQTWWHLPNRAKGEAIRLAQGSQT